MKHVFYIALGLILYGCVIGFTRTPPAEEAACPAPVPAAPAAQAALNYFPLSGGTAQERAAYAEESEQRRHSLTVMEQHRALKARAAEKLTVTRTAAQLAAKSNWEALLKRNMAKFHSLRQEAARQPNGLTPCTICDGMSNLPCVMCDHHDGRCVSCHGTGRHNTELCPSCAGSGKCYLCAGSGSKMLCPFCHDGTLSATGPMPADKPPL